MKDRIAMQIGKIALTDQQGTNNDFCIIFRFFSMPNDCSVICQLVYDDYANRTFRVTTSIGGQKKWPVRASVQLFLLYEPLDGCGRYADLPPDSFTQWYQSVRLGNDSFYRTNHHHLYYWLTV